MASSGSADEAARFRVAILVAVTVVVVFAVLLLPLLPAGLRSSVSSVGLLLAAVVAIVSGLARASRTSGAARRPWLLLSSAGLLPLAGNAWVAVTGADPVDSPSQLGEASIALGLVVSIIGVLAFPTVRRRGLQLVLLVADGLVAGAAMLIIFSVLVYSELLESAAADDREESLFSLVIPVLDIVLATVAIVLVLRSVRTQRLTLGLVSAGFLLYAVADLTFVVRVSRGTFEFGSPLDLGWIAGYVVLALAAWVPINPATTGDAEDSPVRELTDSVGVMLVFAVLLVAALVQIVFGGPGRLLGAQVVAWVVLVVAVGARQTALTIDNSLLRRGLERRVSEQTADLGRLARRTELLLESVGDGIYGVDRDGRITFVNVRAATTLGWAPKDLHGRRPVEVFLSGEGGTERARWTGSAIQRAIAAGVAVTSHDDVYRRADGVTFPAEGTAAPLFEGGEVTGAVVVFRDITQRLEVDRMKDEFLAVVSHELRTPLTSMRASLELMEDGGVGELPAEALRMIAVAREGSERLTRLINDLLDIERIESGSAPMTIMSLDARRLLDDAAQQLEGVVGSMGLRLDIGRAEGRVMADEDQIIQALTNLVGNACKFSPRGSVVRVQAVEDGPVVRFTVQDQGRGIPVDKLEQVFDRFAQVDSSDSRQKGGTGLGLTITRGIVTRHGGTIWAESAVGAGTTISFTLPAVRTGTQTSSQTSTETAPSTGGEHHEGRTREP